MYTGQIYYNDLPITIEDAVSRNLIYISDDNDIYLYEDKMKVVKINGDLHLTDE